MAKSKKPFASLSPLLESTFRELGFERVLDRKSTFAETWGTSWLKSLGTEAHCSIGLQLNKWGYDRWYGSDFTINFRRTTIAYPELPRRETGIRWYNLTNACERKKAEAIKISICSRYHAPGPKELATEAPWILQSEHRDLLDIELSKQQDRLKKLLLPWNTGADAWMPFQDESDLAKWAQFLNVWLPIAIERFLSLEDLSSREALHVWSRWKPTEEEYST